jgi:hypothetical protein
MVSKVKIEDLLKTYEGDIDSFIETIQKIAEDDGEQISNGKNPLEKSDDEEEQEVSDGEAVPAGAAEPQAALSVPGEVPGANVAIGNKQFDNDKADADETQEIKLSGKKDKIDTKPQTKVNPSEYGHIDAAG